MKDFIDAIKLMGDLGFDITSVVFGFIICIAFLKHKTILRIVFQKLDRNQLIKRSKAEEYTITSSKNINKLLDDIVCKDSKISNAILCNYHNNVVSNVNLSYYYFTSITECLGNRMHQCFDVWHEKSYMNYQPELERMHRSNIFYININNPEHVECFPKLSKLIEDSNAKFAVFIAITGINKEIGFLLLLYKDEIKIESKAEYLYTFNKELDEIALLMNYQEKK